MKCADQNGAPAGRRWLRLGVAALAVLAALLYVCRAPIQRVVIAGFIWHSHVFMPPEHLAGERVRIHRGDEAQFYWDLAGFEQDRRKRTKDLGPVIQPLVKEIRRRQAAGEGMQYSMHIYREIRWRLNFTSDLQSTRQRIDDLRKSLSDAAAQKLACEQQASDGSWGMGFSVWYLKLYYSVEDGLGTLDGKHPQYPLKLLDAVNTPGKLQSHMDSLLQDDFTKTGVLNREELDETFSALARLMFGNRPAGYTFAPGVTNALKEFVGRWQNPRTGCWGQWLVDRHGQVWKMDDMAMTFHVVSDFHGNVSHLDWIAERVLQLDAVDFPAGIRVNGHYENHLNWDVVKILKFAWPKLDDATRRRAKVEISGMLKWCLSNSCQPDGSFKTSDLDDTLGDAYSYGVYFLRDAGYFRAKDRFWTDEDFPEAPAVRDRIQTKLKAIGLSDPGLRDAYETLNGL